MHVIIDDFAPLELVRSLCATWLPLNSGYWHSYDNGKLATKDADRLPRAAHLLLAKMAEIPVTQLLAIPGAFPDLEYLHGAGLHHMPCGGSLGLHLDSERHPLLPWRREASVVLYLDDVDGGELELCSDSHGTVTERIEIKANRLVMFTTPGQWHRVAQCHSVRRSLCVFFWSTREGGSFTQANFAPVHSATSNRVD